MSVKHGFVFITKETVCPIITPGFLQLNLHFCNNAVEEVSLDKVAVIWDRVALS